jgi:L-threonylcarbamoyladenylate synthase
MTDRYKEQIDLALDAFSKGMLVAIPTETVYGLGAPINSRAHLERIFKLKERPFFDPLIVHIHSIEQARGLVKSWSPLADCLARSFWPGPLTLILDKKGDLVDDIITSGLPTVGLRMPDHALTLELLKSFDIPLAAPSANKFTQTSPTKAQDVREVFDERDVFVLDGGPCQVGVESSIVRVLQNELTILRLGMVTKSDIETALSKEGHHPKISLGAGHLESVPGNFSAHYQPRWPVVSSDAELTKAQWELIEKKSGVVQAMWQMRTLNEDASLAARELYAMLRTPLEKDKKALIIFFHPKAQKRKEQEQWQSLFDRLKKASLVSFIS